MNIFYLNFDICDRRPRACIDNILCNEQYLSINKINNRKINLISNYRGVFLGKIRV